MAFLLATLALTVSTNDPEALIKSSGIVVPKADFKEISLDSAAPLKVTADLENTLLSESAFEKVEPKEETPSQLKSTLNAPKVDTPTKPSTPLIFANDYKFSIEIAPLKFGASKKQKNLGGSAVIMKSLTPSVNTSVASTRAISENNKISSLKVKAPTLANHSLPSLKLHSNPSKTTPKNFSHLDCPLDALSFKDSQHFAGFEKKTPFKSEFSLDIPTATLPTLPLTPISSPQLVTAFVPSSPEMSIPLNIDSHVLIPKTEASPKAHIEIDEVNIEIKQPKQLPFKPAGKIASASKKSPLSIPEFPLLQEVSANFNSPILTVEKQCTIERVATPISKLHEEAPLYLHAVELKPTQFLPLALENQPVAINLPISTFNRSEIKANSPVKLSLEPKGGVIAANEWIEPKELVSYFQPNKELKALANCPLYIRDPDVVLLKGLPPSLLITSYSCDGLTPSSYKLEKSTLTQTFQLQPDAIAPVLITSSTIDWATYSALTCADETPHIVPPETPSDVIHRIPVGTTKYDFIFDADAPPEALFLNSIVYKHPEKEGKELIAAQQIPPLGYPELVRYPHILHTAALAVKDVVDPLTESGAMFTYTPRIICNQAPEINTVSKILNPDNQAHIELFTYQYPSLARKDTDASNYENRSILYNLTRQPTGNALNNVPSSEQFDIDVTITKRKDRRKGQVFSISIYPNQELNLKPVRQHFTFIIDKTASVKKYRYDMFRAAVVKALNFLQEGDTFNIYVIDRKVNCLSEQPLLWRTSTVQSAKQFLYSSNFSGFNASSTDLYDLLPEVANQLPNTEGENTIILVTDGSSLANIQSKKYTLTELFKSNQGRYTLHTACIDGKSRGAMLDLISTFNRGEFVYSQTNTAFPRKLARLVKHASQRIASDVHVTLTDPDGVNVELFPHTNMVPHLYADRPFTIYGTIDEPKDFELIIQGRFEDRYLYLKKHICLTKARKSTKGLNKQLAVQQAYVCYEHYLNTHDAFYLKQAEERLAEYKLKPATTRR